MMLEENPKDSAAQQTVTALAARWQAITPPSIQPEAGKFDRADHIAFVDQASIAFYQQGDIETAHNFIDQALTLAPGDHYALSLKAEILVAKGLTSEALATYQKAIRLAPFARAYENRLADITPAVQ